MMRLILISLAIVHTHQTSDFNCMQANPGVLDGFFNILYNRQDNFWSVTKEDVANLMSLFSTRFNRAHIFTGIHPTALKEIIAEGVSLFEKESNKTAQIFLSTSPGRTVDETVSFWNETFTTVSDIEKTREGLVGGLYLSTQVASSDQRMEAFQTVFGSNENPQVPIGLFNPECVEDFQNSSSLQILQRLQFVTCFLPPALKSSPEESAVDVVKTCDSLRDTARSMNVSAEVICAVQYHSEGVSPNGIVGSLPDFHRFWCQIVNEVKGNNSHPRIMMWSAFDFSPIPFNPFEVHKIAYHTGWWRRAKSVNNIVQSHEPSSFVEKVDEFLNLYLSCGCTQKPTLFKLAISVAVISFINSILW